jgi:nucleoside-diphosphate-sugar epimerase
MSTARALFVSTRPRQWTKNLIVLAQLIFSARFTDLWALGRSTAAFGLFCIISGGVYLVNDARDAESDRLHERKRVRPIASGALSPNVAMAGETIPLYGGGEQLRDLVFVDDVVRAALAASVESGAWGTAVNVGSGVGVSLREVAEAVVAEVGSGSVDASAPWPADAAAVETGSFYFDVSLAARVLGWKPRVTLQDGIRRLVESAKGA